MTRLMSKPTIEVLIALVGVNTIVCEALYRRWDMLKLT